MRDGLTHALERRLARLRRRGHRGERLRGLAWAVVVLAGGGLALGLIDRFLGLPSAVRALGLGGVLIGLGAVVLRLVSSRAIRDWDDLALARRIERRFPVFGERLVSAVQLLQKGGGRGRAGSAPLRHALFSQTLRQVRTVPVDEVLDRKGVGRAVACAVATTLVLGLVVALYPSTVRAGLIRLAAPYGDYPWTRIVDQSRSVAILGEPFEVRAEITGIIPATAAIRYWEEHAGGRRSTSEHRLSVKVHRPAPGGPAFIAARLPVQGPFRYRIRAYDVESPERAIPVATPPGLLEPTLDVELIPPAYSGMPPTRQTGRGEVTAVRGTQVALHATADRPLRRAWLEFADHDSQVGSPTFRPRSAAVLARDGLDLAVAFDTTGLPSSTNAYTLHLEDVNLLSSVHSFALRVLEDPKPVVESDAPPGKHGALFRLSTTPFDVVLSARDHQFGVRGVGLVMTRLDAARSPAGVIGEVGALVHGAAAGWMGALPISVPLPPLLDAANLPLRLVWEDLEPRWHIARATAGLATPLCPIAFAGVPSLGLPASVPFWLASIPVPLAGVPEGQAIVIRPLVLDNRPDDTGLGWGGPIEIHVVGRQALDRLILEQRIDLEKELRDVAADVRRTRDLMDQVARSIRVDQPLAADLGARLHEAEHRHGRLLRRFGSLVPIDRLLSLLDGNGLARPDLRSRLESLRAELFRLGADHLGRVAIGMAEARQAAALERPAHEILAALGPALRDLADASAALERLIDESGKHVAVEARAVHLDELHEGQRRLLEQTRQWEQRYRGRIAAELPDEARDELHRLHAAQQRLEVEWHTLQIMAGAGSIGSEPGGGVASLLHQAAASLAVGRPAEAATWQRQAVRAWDAVIWAEYRQRWRHDRQLQSLVETRADELARRLQGLREVVLSPTPSIQIAVEAYRRRLQQLAGELMTWGHGDPSRALDRAAQMLHSAISVSGDPIATRAGIRGAEAEIEAALGQLRFDLDQHRQWLARAQLIVLIDRARRLEQDQSRLADRIRLRELAPRDRRAAELLAALIRDDQQELCNEAEDFRGAVDEYLVLSVALARAAGAMRDAVADLNAPEDATRRADAAPHQAAATKILRDMIEVLEDRLARARADSVPPPAGREAALGSPGRMRYGPGDFSRGQAKEPWGHLPASVRKDLEQYAQDRFMPKYQEQLAEYYRALTERRRPPGE